MLRPLVDGVERVAAGVGAHAFHEVFDPHELVVLGQPVRAGEGAGLDLPGLQRHHEVRDEAVLCLPAPVRDHRRVGRLLGHLHRLERLGEGADLVTLMRMELATPLSMPFLKIFVLVTKMSVPGLDLLAQLVGEELPPVPVMFRHGVFHGDDGILVCPVDPEVDHFRGGKLALVRFLEDVFLFFRVIELGGRPGRGRASRCPPAGCSAKG